MAWRIVGIENPASLSLKDNKIVIKQEQEVLIPLEDIDSLILDSYGIQISANLLIKLAQNDVTVLICDEKHLPSSTLLPYSQHSRQTKISREQLSMSLPLQKQIWQKIITQKILNQAAVLDKLNYDNAELLKLAQEVKSGDTTNRESIAARLYFSELLNDETRRKATWENAALNYGYAIVRSVLARCIASRGLIASQGVFHHSELNQFNLVDDLIEPFRPIVDLYVLTKVKSSHNNSDELTKDNRQYLIDILNNYVIINNNRFSIKHAADMTVENLVKTIMSKNLNELNLPLISK